MSSLHADEAFLGHYELAHDPFAPRVPGFKFYPAQRKTVLGQLHHLARYSHLLLAVTGPAGSGKTLLRQALVASTKKDSVQTVVVSAREIADKASLLRRLSQGLGTPQASIQAVLSLVGQVALKEQEVYFLVDDAHELPDDALDVLLDLAEGDETSRPHVFLFGDAVLVSRLESLAQGEERYHAIELLPYTEEETQGYLAQRLEGAGQGLDIFTPEQLEHIHQTSGGWPGGINEAARDTLISAMLSQRGGKPKGYDFFSTLPRKHLVVVAVIAAGVLAALLMKGGDKPGVELASQSGDTLPLHGGAVQSDNPSIKFDGSSQPLPLPLVGEAQPVIREPLAQAAGREEDEGRAVSGAISVGDENNAPLVAEMPTGHAPVSVSAQAQPAAPVAAPPRPASQPIVEARPESKIEPVPVVAKVPAVVTTKAAEPAGAVSGWYGSQTGAKYALQVLGTSSESSAQTFIQQQPDSANYRYFKKMHQGKVLYVVTYGSFANRAAAEAAVKTLPPQVQSIKPWPRTFASIQQDIASVH
ncbi:DamX protein [Pseudomonas duriflava]|uniref:DamX protein n=1 Tax=Pseudomonas duriflava TaxID=459528 RepID=A0A562QBU7_9PSED|nr:AAA family ATPase [Pseudomonas duriflava]TWI54179.1 DamX protein [Pseudomonas duriflava]